jgi:hypothetical protein
VQRFLTFNMGLDKLRYIGARLFALPYRSTRLGNASIPSAPSSSDQGLGAFLVIRWSHRPPSSGNPPLPRAIRSHTTQLKLQGRKP